MTYSARTDNCVTGAETGCVGGRTTGQAGSAMSFTYQPSDMVPFANLAPANTAATDPDFNTYMFLVTDSSTGNANANWVMGDSGAWPAFNQDSTLFLAKNAGGTAKIYQLNPTRIHAKGCSPSTPCAVKSQIATGATDSTHLMSGGAWGWSHAPGETNVLIERSSNGLQVYKDTINTSGDPSTWTLARVMYVDFTSDSPTPCSAVPANYGDNWTAMFTLGNDDSIFVGVAGGVDWQAGWTPTVTETFLYPSQLNGGHKIFQATGVTGPTGGTEPTWSSSCNTTGSTCTDGGVTWTNLSGSSQGSGFDGLSYQPGVGCSRVNTRLGKIYRGTGNAQPAGYWTTDDDLTCARMGQSPPCTLSDIFLLHELNQTFDPAYGLISPSGGTSCLVSGTCSCSDTNSVYRGAWNGSTAYAVHDLVFYNTAWYQSKTSHTSSTTPDVDTNNWKTDDVTCYTYVWQKSTLMVRACLMLGSGTGNDCDQHSEKGYDAVYAGGKASKHLYSKPSVTGAANPGTQMLPTALPADHHGSYQNVTAGDLQPMMMAQVDVPTAAANYTAAGYAEDIMVATDGSETMYRFSHNWNTGSSPTFDIQNATGVISQDGTLAAIGVDMMGTRGSSSPDWAASHAYALGDSIFPLTGNSANGEFIVTTAGTSGNSGSQPAWLSCTPTCTDNGVTWTNMGKSCNNLRAYFAPATNTVLGTGDTILPVTNNTGGDIYQAQSPGGTTGATVPNWNTACPNYGDTCAIDGKVTWKNLGPNTCRGDIVMMDLLSAHPAP